MKAVLVLAAMEASVIGFRLLAHDINPPGFWMLVSVIATAIAGCIWITRGKRK